LDDHIEAEPLVDAVSCSTCTRSECQHLGHQLLKSHTEKVTTTAHVTIL